MKQKYTSRPLDFMANAWNFFTKKNKPNLLAIIFVFLGVTNTFGQFPGNDNVVGVGKTFIIPAGVTSVTTAVWGGGGGGGGCSINGSGGNGGGGGGSTSLTFNVLSGQTITYTVGSGGTAGAAAGGTGGNGTLSSLAHVISATSLLGNPGTGGLGNAAALGTPVNSGGGTASGGANSPGVNGTRVPATGGNGGNSGTSLTIFGIGGIGSNNSAGAAGGTPGAGGAGGERPGAGSVTGGAGGVGRVFINYISVSSITPNPVCVGSTITITGTNFAAGANSVSINGTACTGVVRVNATTITAVVAAGTTSGVVVVTNPNGTNNGQSITVTPLPAANAGGAATVCTGASTPAFTNAVGGGTWSVVNGTGSATISAGGVLTGVSVGTVTVNYTIGTCAPATSNVTVINTPTITGNPANFSTNTGGAASFTVAATNIPTSYTWQVSTDGGTIWTTVVNGGVYSNATTATLNITGATLAMNGYLYHASATNACGTSAYSTAATLTVSNIVLVSGLGLNNVTCGDNTILRDHNNLLDYGNGRNDWSALNVTSAAVVNINGTYDTESGFDAVWLYDGVGIGGTQLAVYTGAGTINYTGNPGQTITVRFTSDGSGVRPGFSLNVTYTGNCIVPCVAPTAQPTALSLSPGGTVISGSFTHASPQPDNYLVVISTNPAAPTPINGTSYAIGGAVGAGYTVVDNDTNNSFSASGLTPSTLYYIYVFSFNKLCIGGPLYNVTTPLTGSTTTLATDPYCFPTYGATTTRYIENVFTVGNITNLNNMGTGRSASGYGDFTATTPVTQIPGGGVAIDYLLRVSRQFVEMWVDWNNDGVFTDAAPEQVYTTGGTQTIEGTGGFVVPGATAPGTYRLRIRTREDSSTIAPCAGLYAAGETEDYRLVVVADCAAKPTFVHDGDRCDNGIVALGVEGAVGVTQFRFYDSLFGGTLIGTQAAVPGITYWNTPFLTATTKYYVTAWNGTCESWYRQEIIATINPTTNIIVTPSIPEVCGENNIVQIDAGGDIIIDYLVNENFEGGFGTTARFNVAADANTQWTPRTSPYVPTGTVWKPAITSSAIGNGFVLANSDFAAPNPKDTQLRTAVLDATAYSTLYLDFRHHFSYYPGEPVQFGYVDISTNGGGAWSTLQTYTSNQGYAGEFANSIIDLTAYAGMNNLMVRFRFYLAGGSAWANGWAIDDVKVYGNRPLNTTFTWTGGTVNAYIDAACTIPYAAQSVTTVYVKPTPLQLASTSWSFTANATLGNGCPVSKLITITNKTKLWKGTVNTDWNQPNNWEPAGVPDANTCVIIYDGPNDSRIVGAFYNAFAKYVIIRPNGDLLVNTDNTLTITDNITVEAGGIATFENGSSLLQVNNTANVGNITYRRTTNVRKQDYVYWSSPIASFANSAVSPGTNLGYQFKWTPTIGANINGFGNWAAANETMVLGKGYCLRAPDSYSLVTLANYTASFVGVPNNGDITIPISRGTYNGADYATGVSTTLGTKDDDNWNFVGNPYPSSIDAIDFLTLNTNISGFVNIWTHGTLPSNATASPFYNTYAYNYTPSDYITYNSSGASSGPGVFNGKINAGQGFFVSMLHTTGATTENLTFNNTLRSNTYNNNAFYKTSDTNKNNKNLEKHRIWFDLVGPSGNSVRSLLGYIENATNENDRLFDAFSSNKLSFKIFSLADNERMLIQGRKLPFDNKDIVRIGVTVPQDGLYKIALSSVDGLFLDTNQNIYLEDRLLNIIYNLKDAPYSFMAKKETIVDRFALRFVKDDNKNIKEVTNQLNVYDNKVLTVESGKLKIKTIQVFDLLGKQILDKNNVNNSVYEINNLTRSNSLLIVKVTLEDNSEEVRKVIY
jgi:hypothetical protein